MHRKGCFRLWRNKKIGGKWVYFCADKCKGVQCGVRSEGDASDVVRFRRATWSVGREVRASSDRLGMGGRSWGEIRKEGGGVQLTAHLASASGCQPAGGGASFLPGRPIGATSRRTLPRQRAHKDNAVVILRHTRLVLVSFLYWIS